MTTTAHFDSTATISNTERSDQQVAYAFIPEAEKPAMYAPRLWPRFVGRVVDIVVALLAGMAASLTIAIPIVRNPELRAFAIVPVTLAMYLPETLFTAVDGQSIGKLIAKTRVVRMDGSRIGVVRAAVRAFAPAIITFAIVSIMKAVDADGLLTTLALATINLADLFGLLTEDSRRIADRIAGTRVVDITPLSFLSIE